MKGLRSFGQAFFAGEPSVGAFVKRPANVEELAEAMAGEGPGCILELRAELMRQNPRGAALVASLCEGGRAVITGQQVGLFLGPLYTFHKALTTVLLAGRLRAQGVIAVPLFWLQVEDHDLTEVEDVAVRRADGTHVALAPSRGSSRISLAHHRADGKTEEALRQLRDALAGLPRASEVCTRMEEAYASGENYASAFTRALRGLFPEDEMLVFNPRTPAAATLALPLHQRATTRSAAIGERLAERSEELARAGYESQVPVRPDCTLSFFHGEGVEGPRYRLRPSTNGFEALGRAGRISEDELQARTNAEPLLFSSSALLRPVIQDHFFPKNAYVGGPGELSYYAQLQPIYEELGVVAGNAVPRMRARYVSSQTRAHLDRWQVDGPLREPASWTRAVPSVTAAHAEVDRLRTDAQRRLATVSEDWPDAAAKAKASVEGALDALMHKVQRQALREPALQRDYQAVLQELEPDGTPQERSVAVVDILARFSPPALRAGLERLYRPLHDTVLEPALETALETATESDEGRLAQRKS